MAPFTIVGNYTGVGGTMAINRVLGGDGSPSDKLVISGGSATGDTMVRVTNVGGPGAETTGNGIQVVSAVSGATTAPEAFALSAGELRAGAFDYDLFRGGVGGASPDDWFLRSDFGAPIAPSVPLVPIGPRCHPPRPLTRCRPASPFRSSGRKSPPTGWCSLWPGNWGSASRHARRPKGRPYEPDGCAAQPAVAPDSLPTRKGAALAPCPLFSPSLWGRFFGQTIHNNYQAFADPNANGDLGGFQGGVDLLHGSLIAGHYDRAGLYGAYGDVHADVNGLVTNPAATAYVLNHTGSMNLNSWSAGGCYWTHTGPGGWYLDAVLQGTWYTARPALISPS